MVQDTDITVWKYGYMPLKIPLEKVTRKHEERGMKEKEISIFLSQETKKKDMKRNEKQKRKGEGREK